MKAHTAAAWRRRAVAAAVLAAILATPAAIDLLLPRQELTAHERLELERALRAPAADTSTDGLEGSDETGP